MIALSRTNEYLEWFYELSLAHQKLVDSRLYRVKKYGHFGDAKYLSEGVAELRWKNGIRVYFVKLNNSAILLLLGGLKNGQKKDIKKARLLLRKYADFKG